MGTYGVMGNNDYERCHDDIVNTMKHYGMRPLEHEVDTLRKDGQQIIIAGVRNPFDLGRNGYRLLWHSLPKILSSYWFTPRITSKMFQ